ncbi:MAG: sulfur carrier protein ThiS [Synergistaceae bacterium]|nr:sulfur carrier protein ThiS [Synergistaceae bacterium]
MITVNGCRIDLSEGNRNLSDCLDAQGYRTDRVVVVLNEVVVRRNAYSSVILKDGDVMEVLHFVGGG